MSDYSEAKVVLNKQATSFEESKRQYELERAITTVREKRLLVDNPIHGNFDFKHIAQIHKALFDGLYDHAGIARTHDFHRSLDRSKGSFFENHEKATATFDEFSQTIKQHDFYRDLSQQEFVEKFTQHYADLNFAHPFEEGNGRSLRIFMSYVANKAGYNIDFSYKHPLWNEASYLSSPKKFITFEHRAVPSNAEADTSMLQRIFTDIIEKKPELELPNKHELQEHYSNIGEYDLSDDDLAKIEAWDKLSGEILKNNPQTLQKLRDSINQRIPDIVDGTYTIPTIPNKELMQENQNINTDNNLTTDYLDNGYLDNNQGKGGRY